MTTQEINNNRNEKGIFQISNESAGWSAISREGINMITFANGDNKFYTLVGFAKRITKLLNCGC
jgi:hypothetical protein